MPQSLASVVRANRERQRAEPAAPRAADSLYVAQGNPRSPAAQALAEEAGKRLGLPPMLVDEAAMEQARVQKNMEALSQAHRTAGWISDPNNAAVAHDQVESLTGIEGLLSVMRSDFAKQYIDGPRQIAGGVYEAIGGSLYGLGLTGERALDRFGLSESARQASRVPGMAFLNAPAFLKEVGARNRRAASYLRGEEGSERALSAGSPDLLPRLNYDRGFVGDVEAGLGQIAGQVLMHVGSGGMASLPTMFGQGVTQMDERVQEAQAREGRSEYSAKDDVALAAGGVVTALTEKLGLDAVIGALPAPIRSRLTSKIADIGVAGLTEGFSEAAEGVGQNAIARYVLGEETALLDGSVAYEGGVGATVGSLARALVLTAVPGRQHGIDAQRAERAKSQHETFDAAVQAAVQNPLRERSPERFASFLRDAAEGGSEVYVPAEAVATFFQSNPDLDVWMDEWDIRDQVEEALAAGTDVVFDQATYLAKVAPTAAHAAWGEDLRHGIDGMSKREAADFEATGEERLTGEIDAAIDQAQAEEAQVAPERQVRDAIFSQLREAGYTLDAANAQATVAARTFASLAERNPEVFADAMAAYQDASLTIKQDFPEVIRQSMDRIDAMIEGLRRRSARPTDRRLFGRSMMEFLAQRGGVIDTGGELAALGVDAWHRPSQGGKAFRRRFIRDGAMGGNEFAPDLAALAAVEAGYLPEGSGPNELFAAIRDELAGRPVYSQAFETDLQSKENANALDELERLLADLGIDPTTETDNAKIKAALERAAEPFPGDASATYDQAGRLKTDTPAFKAWFGDSKAVDANGEPLVVYHGGASEIDAFATEGRGKTSGAGAFFSSDPMIASTYAPSRTGGNVTPVYVSLQTPMVVEVGGANWSRIGADVRVSLPEITADRSEENTLLEELGVEAGPATRTVPAREATVGELFDGLFDEDVVTTDDLSRWARQNGYDGVIFRQAMDRGPNGYALGLGEAKPSDIFVAFRPEQIKSVFNRGTFDPSDPRILYQSAPSIDDDRNLVAVHNLSEANLLNVAKVGGLAVPSMAVVRGDHVFPNFGEITLVAPPSLVDPKENKAAKVFGADVYSPRYPRAKFELDEKAKTALEKRLKPSADALGEYLYLDTIEEDGLDVLDGQYGRLGRIVRHAFLAERNDPAIKAEGDVRAAIETRIEELRAEFDAWREGLADGLVKRERIFDGYTASGRRKYLDHNLDNVVKILKRGLRDGEAYDYGVGSIRSKVTPQFKSLKAIKAAKDRLVSPEEMQALKDEADQAFITLGERLQPKLKWKSDAGYLSLFSEHVKEVADTRRASSLDAYYDGLTDDDRRAVVDFLERLRTMPTEYFEAKIQRAVGLDEFVGAVVPSTISARARKVLEDAGLRVVEYEKGDTEAAQNAARMMGVQTFRDDTFFQSDTPFTGPRGQISLAQGRATITLFQSRDLSTFFHEFGHLTLEMLIDVASHPKASAQTKADLQTILDWFSREAGETITVENLGVDQHELWARGTERYLMEGKAPSLELREVFRTVAAWLKRIYSTVLALDAPITDDVRAVMDRLLASDAEIAQARQVSGQETGVDVLRQQGMTDAEAAAYEKAVARARSDAESDLLGKVMGAIRRRVTKEWNDAAEEIRPEITAEVDAMPDIAAIEFITTTRTPLDRETVVAMLGDEAGLSLLPKRVPPLFSATGGQHPDMVAEAAGYRSGQELLNGLMDHAAEKRRLVEAGDKRSVRQARIEERVREALLDRFGDVLNDGSIEQEAIDAIHSERYGDILAMDLAVLARKAGQQPAPIDALRAWARERVGSRPVREARPGRYLRAERSASTAVQKALAAGDRDEAFRQKQAQVINNVLYVEAGRAERFAEAAINRMRKLARGKNPSIHVDYMEQINAILEQYELKEVSGRTVQRRKSLAAFKEEREKAGEPVNIPAEVLASLDKTNLADLTVDELRGLDETVKHLVHLGRMKTKLIVMGEERDLNRVGDEVLERSAYIKDRKISEAPGAQTWLEERRADFDGAVAALRKMQEIARRMDGSDTEGPFHDNLDRPSMEAANRKARLAADFYTPIKAAVDAIPKEIKARWMDTLSDHPFVNPRTGVPLEGMKRADLIAVALNVGTLSNFESMAKGWGVISSEADAVAVSAARLGMIQWLNERLDASEWAYVQAWWDAHERLRGEYFAAARKVEGFEPEAVDAEPVTTPAGVLKGGYAPLIYHPDFDEATLQRNQKDDADPLGGLGRSGPRPDNGATISRTGYSGPVDLRMDSHRMAADKHLTYAAYAEFVSNALKFINHRPIREAVITKLGKPVYDTIRPWLESQVRNDTVNDPNAKFWQKILRQSRSNIVMASLLGSVTVMLAQGSGLVASAAKIGPAKLARGVAAEIRLNRMTGGDGVFDYVAGKSDFMRLRLEEGELDRDIKFALAKSQAGVKLKAEAATLAGKAIAAVDFYLVSGPTWLGVYESEIEAGRDEADAVYAADMAVSTTQGGGRARDMSGFMRGNDALKMGTIAFGWASAFENMVSGAVFDIRHGQNVGRNVGTLSALFILMPLMDAVMSGDLPAPGEDDEETLANYADWFMRNVVTNVFVGIPFARDLSSWVEREWAGEYTGTIGQTPNGRILSEFTRLYKDIKAAVDDEKDVSHRWPAHVISAVGYSFGIPGTSQAARATNYGLDVAVGDQNPETALDVVTGVVRGPQDDQR